MVQKGKILVTEEGVFDLATYRWDDHRFSDLLVRENSINSDQAMDISRFLREEIGKMELHTITMPVIEKIIEEKFGERFPAAERLQSISGDPISNFKELMDKMEILDPYNQRSSSNA